MTERGPEERATHTNPTTSTGHEHTGHEEKSRARAEAYGATATVERDPDRARRERVEPSPRRHADDERSMIGLVRALFGDVADLVRQEATLVRVEMTEKVEQARDGAVSIGAGAGIAYAGLIFLLLSATFGLSNWMEPWVAALIVGGLTTLIGMAMLASGRSRLKARNLTPERSARSLRKDAELMREETRRAS